MVIEGDFVAGVITSSTKAKPNTGFNVFAFPSVGDSPPAVVGGGDVVVMFKDNPAPARSSSTSRPRRRPIWAKRGGFSSPNKKVTRASTRTRSRGRPRRRWRTRRRSASTCPTSQPAAFGGTAGQGVFKELQDFLKNPTTSTAIAAQMEAAAAKAYEK